MRRQVRIITTGRRSGEAWPVTLYAFDDGERLVIVGSRGGAARDPSWAANLRNDPRATLKVGRRERAVRATEVDRPERDRLWELACADFPLYAAYQRRTKRRIPLFALKPSDEA